MQDLLVSINKNVIRLSTVDKENQLRTTLVDISKDAVSDTQIINSASVAVAINDLLPHISSLSKNKLSLNFALEPQDVYIRFMTIPKKDIDLEEQIISEIKEKASDIPLDETYFSYKKIAPFVYQFIAVKKDTLEKFIEVSNELGVGLKSVVPWVMLLPKYEKVNDPAIFITKNGNRQVLVLSELGGVFFAESYDEDRKEEEIQALIKDLSFYKRSTPIKNVYTLNCDYLKLEGFNITEIKLPEFTGGEETNPGYEENVLINYFLDSDPEFVNSQMNALNLLPVPVVENKSFSLVAAGSFVALFLLLAAAFGGYQYLKGRNSDTNALAQNNDNKQVLSETTTSPTPTVTPTPTPKIDLKRSDIKIRIENAAGISGLAGRTQELLVKTGYNVVSIDTADNDVEDTILRFKKGKSGYAELLKADISISFPNITVKEDLPDTASYDLLMLLGKSSKL